MSHLYYPRSRFDFGDTDVSGIEPDTTSVDRGELDGPVIGIGG